MGDAAKTVMNKIHSESPPSSLTIKIADTLREYIVSGNLTDGFQLRQEIISREFGVSRIPVREALRLLEVEGLVTLLENKGARVSCLSPVEVIEILQIRKTLECNLMFKSIPNQTMKDFKKIATLINELQLSFQAGNVGLHCTLTVQFFMALYNASGRPQTLFIIRQLLNRTSRYLRIPLLAPSYSLDVLGQYEKLLQSCQENNPINASSLLRAILLSMQDMLEDHSRIH